MLEIKRLGHSVDSPSFFVNLNDVSILLDCPNPFHKTTSTDNDNDLNKEISWDEVDLILVSNTFSFTYLPYFTEMTEFRGRVLTTEPVLKFGKIILEDIITEFQKLPSDNRCARNEERRDKCIDQEWFTVEKTTASLSKIQTVAYHEFVDIFGLLKVKCVSAGLEIGSCNWVLETAFEKVFYLSRCSLYTSFALSIDCSEFLDIDVLIVGSVNTSNSKSIEQALERFCTITVQTLARGGHVLVPVLPAGLVFQLIESVFAAKEHFNGNLLSSFDSELQYNMSSAANGKSNCIGLGTLQAPCTPGSGVSVMAQVSKCPILFISNQAKASLKFANAYGEWLAPEREIALYTADSPFQFDLLMSHGHLATLTSLHSPMPSRAEDRASMGTQIGAGSFFNLQQRYTHPTPMDTSVTTQTSDTDLQGGLWPSSPCVFFTGHPSCCFGNVVHLIRALAYGGVVTDATPKGAHPQHSIILVHTHEWLGNTSTNRHSLADVARRFQTKTESSSGDLIGEDSLQLGDSATLFWLPLRSDLTSSQLVQLLITSGFPKQSLVLPAEIAETPELQPSFHGNSTCALHSLAYLNSVSVKLKLSNLLPVKISPELLTLVTVFNVQQSSRPFGNSTSKSESPVDPRTVTSKRKLEVCDRKSVSNLALIDGLLSFRDGRYRLEPPYENQMLRPSSPPSPGKDACCYSLDFRLLVSKTSIGVDPLRLIKHLTESGVTGGHLADVDVIHDFLERRKQYCCAVDEIDSSIDSESIPPNPSLILFPNNNTSIFLSQFESHIFCQDDGIRAAIRDAIMSCAKLTGISNNNSHTTTI